MKIGNNQTTFINDAFEIDYDEEKFEEPAASPETASKTSYLLKYHKETTNQATLLFSGPSYYHPCILILMSIAPLALLALAIMNALFLFQSERDFDFGLCMAIGFKLLLIVIFYLIAMPRNIQVYSNGKIVIQTTIWAFTFAGTRNPTRVYAVEDLLDREGFCRPRIKFMTGLSSNRVIVQFEKGWDLAVSPNDVNGFVSAVNEAISSTPVVVATATTSPTTKTRNGNKDLSGEAATTYESCVAV